MRVGDWVEIRSLPEIMATLDARGDLERLPFMPEMAAFAGRRFQVSASAHKTCDTVNRTGGRSVAAAVHLADLRCDGSSHGGCQAACLLYWKTAWLRRVPGPASGPASETASTATPDEVSKLQSHCASTHDDGTTVFSCQATTLPAWSRPLAWWDARQYWRDVRAGNATATRALTTLLLAALHKLQRLPFAYRLTRWTYQTAHRLLRGQPDPHPRPGLRGKAPTPTVELGLQAGELVEIRSVAEINQTINERFRNRGLYIDADDLRFSGRRARVQRRVTRIINEGTGEMMHFDNPCIVLEGVNCLGDYAEKRLLCPRRINTYWREAWLKRVEDDGANDAGTGSPAGCSPGGRSCRAAQ